MIHQDPTHGHGGDGLRFRCEGDAFFQFKVIEGFDPEAIAGDEEAAALGVDPGRLRILFVAAATLMTAGVVAIAGIVGWVGLVMPHIARLLVGPNFHRLLPTAMLMGAGFLLLVDTIARTLTATETPLGILTAFVGAPVGVTGVVIANKTLNIGGLLDIDFLAQLGILECAPAQPQLRRLTSTQAQLQALADHGWIEERDAADLVETHGALTRARHLHTLLREEAWYRAEATPDTRRAQSICRRYGILDPAQGEESR